MALAIGMFLAVADKDALALSDEEPAAAAEAAEPAGSGPQLKWEPGPTVFSPDGDWSVHVRGRLYGDTGFLDDDDGFYSGELTAEWRAARLGLDGVFHKDFHYKFEVDFAYSDVDIKDAYVEYNGASIEPLYVKIGQAYTPNSLESQTSSLDITFMERAAIVNAFSLGRRVGVMIGSNWDENWGFEFGGFGQNAADTPVDEGYAASGRFWVAMPQGDGGDVIHLGGSLRYRDLDNDVDNSTVTYLQRPFFHFTSLRSVNTGSLPNAESDVWAGGEFLWIDGPFSIQSEVANTWTDVNQGSNPDNLWGGYLGLSYFLTDDMRSYSKKTGLITRTNVGDPVQEGGWGAWEVAGRLDYVDLNSGVANGGEQYSYIVGLNWYLNNFARLMLDGAYTQVEQAGPFDPAIGGANDIWGIGLRAQIDW